MLPGSFLVIREYASDLAKIRRVGFQQIDVRQSRSLDNAPRLPEHPWGKVYSKYVTRGANLARDRASGEAGPRCRVQHTLTGKERSYINKPLGKAPMPAIVRVSFGAGVENIGDFTVIHRCQWRWRQSTPT